MLNVFYEIGLVESNLQSSMQITVSPCLQKRLNETVPLFKLCTLMTNGGSVSKAPRVLNPDIRWR